MIPPRFHPGRKVCVLDAADNIITTTIICVATDKDENHSYCVNLGPITPYRSQGELYLDYPSALTERERRAKTKQGSLQP